MAKSSPKHFFSKLASVSMPRSKFDMSYTDTVTVTTDYLYPNMCQFILPGDTVTLDYSNKIRLISPIDVPMMDNLYCDCHWWFVPMRLVWDYTKQFFGEQRRPSDPTDFTIPQVTFSYTSSSSNNLPTVGSIYDYFGIPINGTDNVMTAGFSVNALPFRSYNLIYDEWYRDEQRCNYAYYNVGNTSTASTNYMLLKRGKRFDYFTSSLLEPQIGNPVDIPLGSYAPVIGNGNSLGLQASSSTNAHMYLYNWYNSSASGDKHSLEVSQQYANTNSFIPPSGTIDSNLGGLDTNNISLGVSTNPRFSGLVADLTNATPATIATLRQAFQLQAYNEINARNGNRYTEFLYGQYGVISPDARLQRPEFLGGTHQRLYTMPVVQTSEGSSGGTAQGNLAAYIEGSTVDSVFTRSFTEHGYIIGILNIYSDLTYYQGLDRHWSMVTPLDIPLPVFGNLTDEEIKRKEILLTGNSATDNDVFGYGERYAWAKYNKNTLRGLVRPNAPLSIGYWSLAQQLPSNVSNNDEFIESYTDIDRITAVSGEDSFIVNQEFNMNIIRALPAYANPEKWMFRG